MYNPEIPENNVVNFEQSRSQATIASRFWSAVIVFAICSLTISLATRFAVVTPDVHKLPSVQSELTDAKRQHLLSNALQWTAPIARFTSFEPAATSVRAFPVTVLPTYLTSETWLDNRPPPAC
jgi:hypothetical protein